MVVEVYLDDTLLYDEPIGIRDIKETIERDNTLHGYVLKYSDIDLTFYGDGYKYIIDKIRANQYDNRIYIKILLQDGDGYTDRIQAVFFTNDVEINFTENTIQVSIEDNNFGAYIKSGSKEKIIPTATLSRNGETITPVTATDVTMFTPSTGVNLGTDAKMFDINSVLELLIAYLSDNNLDYSNDTGLFSLTKYGLTKHYFIATGTRGTTPDNQISFKELMDFMWKAFGIMFWIDLQYDTPTFRIALENDLMEEADGSINFTDVKNLKLTFDQDIMYSTIKLGSENENIDIAGTTYTLPYSPLINFGEENVNARSYSMLDNVFDLSFEKIICGTNKIEEFITSTSYKENHVIIQYSSIGNNASKGTYGKSGASRLYNQTLLNINVLENHNHASELVSEIGTDTESFKAYLTNDQSIGYTASPVVFDDDSSLGYDTGGNYNNGTGIYTIPATGIYIFETEIWIHVTELSQTGASPNGVTITVAIQRNGSNIGTGSFIRNGTSETPIKVSITAQAYFELNDTVEVDLTVAFNYVGTYGTNTGVVKGEFTYIPDEGDQKGIRTGTNFSTKFIYNSGGAVITPDKTDYPCVNYQFDYGIDLKTWKSLRSRSIQGVYVNTNGNNKTMAWVKNISRNWISGESDVNLFTKLSENNFL